MKTLPTLAVAFFLSAPFSFAADADNPAIPARPKSSNDDFFKRLDKDGDGFLSFEEYKVSTIGNIDPARVADLFKKKDQNGDGKLTLEEFKFVPPKTAPKATPKPK